jgi:antitoxin CptB
MEQTPHETRLKRLRMRSWRRGMKEMDLILGPFSDTRLAELDGAALDAYEQLLDENDQELYLWVTGARDAPEHHHATLARIRDSIMVQRAT